MIRLFAALICLLPALAPDAALAQSPDQVLAEAQADCEATEGRSLRIPENPFLSADLTGDGQPETILDTASFLCSGAPGMFAGSGGSTLYVWVDGVLFAWLAEGWGVVSFMGKPVLLLQLDWNECAVVGAQLCTEAVTWGGKGFISLRGLSGVAG